MLTFIETVRRLRMPALSRGWTILLLTICAWIISVGAGAFVLRLLFWTTGVAAP